MLTLTQCPGYAWDGDLEGLEGCVLPGFQRLRGRSDPSQFHLPGTGDIRDANLSFISYLRLRLGPAVAFSRVQRQLARQVPGGHGFSRCGQAMRRTQPCRRALLWRKSY